MLKFIIVLFFLIPHFKITAQVWQSPWLSDKKTGLQNANLREVFFLDNQNGWAGGVNGEFYRTKDGGVSWESDYHQFLSNIKGIYFASSLIGKVHAAAAVYETNTAGAAWLAKGSVAFNNDIFYYSSTLGWAVDGTSTSAYISKTTDGGENWSLQIIAGAAKLQKVFFVSASNGWAVGDNGVILATTDGGATWSAQTSGTTEDLMTVSFINNLQGWISGTNGILLTTANGGATWTTQVSGTTSTINDIVFVSSTQGWYVSSTSIRSTTNGGATWTTQSTSSTNTLYDIEAISATQLCAVGTEGNILYTFNGGTTWSKVYVYIDQLFGVDMANDQLALGVGGNGMIRSDDGGSHFSPVVLPAGTTNTLNDVQFINNTTAWSCGGSGDIIKTTDGGNTWILQSTSTAQTLHDIFFIDANQGWCVGGGGTILATTNGGTTWTAKTSGTASTLYSVFFINANRGWAGGTGGVFLTTTDGGNTWTSIASGTTGAINDIYFFSDNTGLVCGSFGVRRTTDAGVNWTATLVTSGVNINEFEFISPTEGWCVGDFTKSFHKTTDGGITWTTVAPFGNAKDVSSVVIKNQRGIAVGRDNFKSSIFLYSCRLSITNSLPLTAVTQTQDASKIEYFGSNNCGNLIARVYPFSIFEVSGDVTAKVWVDVVQTPLNVKRYYEIQPAVNATNAVAVITLYFNDAEFAAFNAYNGSAKLPLSTDPPSQQATGISNLRIVKRSGTSSNGSGDINTYSGALTVIDPPDEYIKWNGRFWEVSFATNGFSGFWVTSISVVLPVELLSFSGVNNAGNNILYWTTASEINTSHFEVQRSDDGQNYSSIGRVNAIGGMEQKKYRFTDNKAVADLYYYRLKMIDNDGSFKFSSVVMIKTSKTTGWEGLPNPTTGTIHIWGLFGSSYYQLFDKTGKLLRYGQVRNNENIIITELPQGLYFLVIDGKAKKIIKQ